MFLTLDFLVLIFTPLKRTLITDVAGRLYVLSLSPTDSTPLSQQTRELFHSSYSATHLSTRETSVLSSDIYCGDFKIFDFPYISSRVFTFVQYS